MPTERSLIKGTQFIISTKVDNVRSSGNVLSDSGNTYAFARFDTAIVDADYFEKYSQLISAAGNRDMITKVGAISLDGLYVPYSTSPDYSGILPHFETPTSTGEGVINVNTLNPFNPANIFGTGVLNTGLTDTGTYNSAVWTSGGHNITAAFVNSPYSTEESMEAKVHPVSSFFDADFYYRRKTELRDIRAVAHRAPLILSGPGYDISGNPVPSGESGIMHPQAYSDPSLWKTGPLDVRWDDEKKIWSAAGGSDGIIQFRPTDVCEGIGLTCDCVTAIVLTSSCGSSVNIGDEVQVWDQSRGWFEMPEELLFNSVGWAHKVKISEVERSGLPFDIGNCRWVVTSMDCIEASGV